jgi:4-hydroxybenzoate polyprenyltransferase
MQGISFALQGLFASRIFVALVVGLIYALSMPNAVSPSFRLALFMVGFCVIWATYLWNVYTDQAEDAVNTAGIHVAISKPLILMVLLAPIPLFVDILGFRGLAFFVAFFIACNLYAIRIPYLGIRIKDVFLLKNIYPGLIVVAGLAGLRMLIGFPVFLSELILIFFIYLGNEILWDIRDMQGDKAGSTLPQRLGVPATKALITVNYIVVLALYATYWPWMLGLAWLPVLIVIIITWMVQPNQNPILFHVPVLAWACFLGILLWH